MVKVHKRALAPSTLEAVEETPAVASTGRPVRDRGFAVLFAACVELQELLQTAEKERECALEENGALRRQVEQLQSRCGELTDRVRLLQCGSGEGFQALGECVCGGRPVVAPAPGDSTHRQAGDNTRQNFRSAQVPLHALFCGNCHVDGSSSENRQEGARESGVFLEEDGDVNWDEIPMGNDIWALMDQSVRLRIEQWVVEQGRAVKVFGPPSEQPSVDGSIGRSSTRYRCFVTHTMGSSCSLLAHV
jgi:hypothetical protein